MVVNGGDLDDGDGDDVLGVDHRWVLSVKVPASPYSMPDQVLSPQ